MTQEKSDLRVRRTQKMLQEALVDLVAERGLDAISVGDIAERAMVNRATFYRHYQDKYDLAEKIFIEVLNHMMQIIGQPRLPLSRFDINKTPVHFIKLFEHIDQNHKLYEVMLGPRGNPLFAARLRDQIVTMIQEREELREKSLIQQGYTAPESRDNLPPLQFVAVCAANMLIGMISWWLEAGRPYSVEQMATWVVSFIARGYIYNSGNLCLEPNGSSNGWNASSLATAFKK